MVDPSTDGIGRTFTTSDGQTSWKELLSNYHISLDQRRYILMHLLDTMKMNQGQEPNVSTIQVNALKDELLPQHRTLISQQPRPTTRWHV